MEAFCLRRRANKGLVEGIVVAMARTRCMNVGFGLGMRVRAGCKSRVRSRGNSLNGFADSLRATKLMAERLCESPFLEQCDSFVQPEILIVTQKCSQSVCTVPIAKLRYIARQLPMEIDLARCLVHCNAPRFSQCQEVEPTQEVATIDLAVSATADVNFCRTVHARK